MELLFMKGLKIKLKKYKTCSGKNNSGKITVYRKGCGHKKRYRQIDFKLNSNNNLGIVFTIEYDPNRNCNIATIFYVKLKNFRYILAPRNLLIGSVLENNFKSLNRIGHTKIIKKIPVGCCIYNITTKLNGDGKFSRSAGTYSVIIKKTQKFAILILSSGKKKKLFLNCFATIGIVSNEFYFLTQLKKAGRSRWLSKRPTVRGVAKNPVDHPNGGGEGKKSGKRKTAWGKVLKSPKKK